MTGQIEFHEQTAPNRGLLDSRRWGKDVATAQEESRQLQDWMEVWKPENIVPRIHSWFLSPNYKLARDWARNFSKIWPYSIGHQKSERVFELPNDTLLEFQTADDPELLVSVGLDSLTITEAQLIPDDAITQLRPTLISPWRFGLFKFTGIPWPVPWQEEFVSRADSGDPDFWYSMEPSAANPHINLVELQKEIDRCPEFLRDPLYLGKRPKNQGAVFRYKDSTFFHTIARDYPVYGARKHSGLVFDGLDLARLQDFMVYTAFELRDDGRLWQIAQDRFNKQDWELQYERVVASSRNYRHRIGHGDITGLGDPCLARLSELDCEFRGVNFTSEKKRLVRQLSIFLDQDRLRLFDREDTKTELRQYAGKLLPQGGVSYGAPAGGHDDIVTSIALAVDAYCADHAPMSDEDAELFAASLP